MDQLNKEDFFKILEKFKAGTATPEEIRFLDAYYESFGLRADYTPQLDDAERTALKEDLYASLQSRLAKPSAAIGKIRYWPRVAAAALLLISLSTGLYIYTHQKNKGQQMAQTPISPGGNKAILTLANGQQISLTDAANGQLASQSGMRITKTAKGQLVYELAEGETGSTGEPQYNTITVPVGGQWQAVLADGSHVWLNALSSITFPTIFTGKERRVEIKGEAYFEIAHDKSKPFKVASLGQTVEVLGTHFNVMAYPDEKVIKTTLLEGSVRLSDAGKTELLKPGEQAQVVAGEIKVTNDVDIEDVVAWKNGYFKFNENLESTMNKIARWYNVEVVYEDKPDNSLSFGGEISRTRNIRDVLNIMEYTGKVHFKIEGRRVVVKK